MSDEDDEIAQIRQKKLAEMQRQAASKENQEVAQEAQRREFEAKKLALMRQILVPEARQRIENIRMVKPEFAERVEMTLIQMFQGGQLRGAIPLSDDQLKQILQKMQNKKPDFKIHRAV
ncbi:MAG TPA: DNA-binding protein [Candidatus Lokiarchaeia archaeon]|nr:DNA-binding protein [Candidatus Lokiarchaeia archaeon]